ncbi:hypothetical protein NN3_24860 [Nocardia neocaledoniensis NBRC 108232]|uniref:DUF1152 domain-containing protein n=1 Tax=Nocardia neocaledoniensis TaxID=236511 RepID=A0A317NXF2_9NOCA|nr:DUF1152 domain-containing protein [Nocardia neocaledoniensis]PWV79697.1 hypothetical protein DFR69_102763 [Nocardia neocaledoniensis]GEM31479.1 hypothetical protein NN3_24860 [Nocardia neocaledoniensis NBRC 108232]
MTAIAIAAGGGGDAVTAAVIAQKMPDLRIEAIMSYSWDRLIIDPSPGPRSSADFYGLIRHDGFYEVTSTAGLRTGGHSTLPRLTRHIDLPILLMDINAGTTGLSNQIRSAAAAFDAEEIVVVDVGGDIVAAGHEPGLRSPLADSVALAAATMSGLTSHVLVAGVGLDGELPVAEVDTRLTRLDATDIAVLTRSDVRGFEPIWSWHPSEANGLLAAGAAGWRGTVETQRNSTIRIDDATTHVFQLRGTVLANDSLSTLVLTATSLAEIEQVLRSRRGYSDVDVERNRLSGHFAARTPTADVLAEIDQYSKDAAARGIDALTIRRVIELAGATDTPSAETLRELLSRQRPDRFRPPLFTARSLESR